MTFLPLQFVPYLFYQLYCNNSIFKSRSHKCVHKRFDNDKYKNKWWRTNAAVASLLCDSTRTNLRAKKSLFRIENRNRTDGLEKKFAAVLQMKSSYTLLCVNMCQGFFLLIPLVLSDVLVVPVYFFMRWATARNAKTRYFSYEIFCANFFLLCVCFSFSQSIRV